MFLAFCSKNANHGKCYLFSCVHLIQGFTYPVRELFLEDMLEKTKYHIESEFDSFQGSGRRKRRQVETKKDSLLEVFEVFNVQMCKIVLSFYQVCLFISCFLGGGY